MAAANQAVVGVLRAMLTADTAQFDTGMAKANSTLKLVEKNTKQVGVEVQKLTPQAERMVKAFSGDKLLYSANNLVTAITKIGGATKLTEAEQAKANRTLTAAIEKYAALGQKAPPAMVALQKATAGATTETQRFGMSMTQVSTVLGAFGISLGVSSVVAFGRELLNTADQLVKVADRTGLTTTEVQKLQYIAGQSGNSLEELTGAVSRLQNNLVTGDKGAVAAVKALGLNLEALRRATPFEQMSQIATAIAKIPDPATRAAIAIDLFGRAGAAILPTLISDFEKLGEAAPNMSDATVRALDQAGDAIGKFQMQLKVWAAESYNFLGRLFDQFVNFTRRGTAALLDAIADIMEFQAKIPGVAKIWGAFGINIDAIRQKATWFRDAADSSAAALGRTEVEIRKNTGAFVDYEGAVKGGTKALSDAEKAALKAAEAQKAWLASISDLVPVFSRWVQVGNDANVTMKDSMALYTAMPPAINAAAASIEGRLIPAASGLAAAFESSARAKSDLDELMAGGFLSAPAAIVSEGASAEAQRITQTQTQERLEKQRDQIVAFWKNQAGALESATLGRVGSLFFGQLGHDVEGTLKAAADEAHQDFLKIQRDGKATAEELTLAFNRWREAEDRANLDFGERWKHWMGGIKQTFVSILDDMLQYFIKNFIGGLAKGLTASGLGQKLGQALGFGGGGGGGGFGGIGGGVANSFAARGLMALGGGGGGTLAAGTVSNGVLVGVGAGGGAGAAPAGAAGVGGGAGGSFLSNPAFWTNPYTIGIGVGIGIGMLVWKKGLFRGGAESLHVNPKRDKFLAQFGGPGTGPDSGFQKLAERLTKITGQPGGGPLHKGIREADTVKEWELAQGRVLMALSGAGMKNVRGFSMGGFVPPGVVQPAILHGGRFGEDIVPRTSATLSGSPTLNQHYTVNIHANALNAEGMDAVFARDIVPRLQWEFRLNQRGTITVLEKAMAR